MTDSTTTDGGIEISIIVPVYNVALYIEECLESLEQQSFALPFETILIDDCSTDGSLKVCQEFAHRSPEKFRLLQNNDNQGVSATRNNGLYAATGKYFMFVDPDDLLPTDALTLLHEAANSSGCSIVKGNNTIFDTHSETPASYNVSRTRVITTDAVLTTLFLHDKVRGHPWGKLFRSDQLASTRFPLGVRMAQDLFYNCAVFALSDSLLLLDQNVYRYRNRDSGSTGNKFRSGSYLDWLDSVEKTAQFVRTPGHRQAHKNLLIRTLTQLARECRKLPELDAQPVLETILQRCEQWNIKLSQLLFKDKVGIRSLSRYLKMRMAIRETRQLLSRTQSCGDSTRN